MKAAPTLDGRIRIDVEDALDLLVLRSIVADAGRDDDLADELAAAMDSEVRDDWDDYVLPDLRLQFQQQLRTVLDALGEVYPGGTLFIDSGHAADWFGALNQARLTLEDRFDLSAFEDEDPPEKEARSAKVRSRFYQMLQGLLLGFILNPENP
jgi:hypothetical protein